MLEKVKEFFEQEYKDTERLLTREDRPFWAEPKECVDKAIQRCLGVAQFVQYCDVKYEDLGCYEEIRERFEKLLEETLDKDRKKQYNKLIKGKEVA